VNKYFEDYWLGIRMKVLVVGDDERIARYVHVSLKVGLSDIKQLSNNKLNDNKITEMVEKESPDMVIIDSISKDTNNLALIKQVQNHVNIPVIVLTSLKSNVSETGKVQDYKAETYLAKPIGNKEFTTRLEALIEKSKNN
jgi:DNA-binding response OmpR family regulator